MPTKAEPLGQSYTHTHHHNRLVIATTINKLSPTLFGSTGSSPLKAIGRSQQLHNHVWYAANNLALLRRETSRSCH